MKAKVLLALILSLFVTQAAFAGMPKIAFFSIQQVVNESKAGKAARSTMEAYAQQEGAKLNARQRELQQLVQELQNSMMMSPETKQQKQQQAQAMNMQLQNDAQKFQQEMRQREAEFTKQLAEEVKTVVEKLGPKLGYDMIIESGIRQGIFFSSGKIADVTGKVVAEYNKTK